MQKNPAPSKQKALSSQEGNYRDSVTSEHSSLLLFGYAQDLKQLEVSTIKIDYKEPINTCKEILFKKYFDAFNFYFSKHINEILADMPLPHVILYKDYLYFDDDDEYLRRWYRIDETKPRIQNLTKFYASVEGNMNKPNLAIHDQNEIIMKRGDRLHEIFVNKIKNYQNPPKSQRENEKPMTFRVLPKYDEPLEYFDESSESNARAKPKKANDMLFQDQKPHNSYQREMDMDYESYQESYETVAHDVYNPSPASSCGFNKSIKEENKIDDDKENKLELSGPKLLEDSLSLIGKTGGRESRTSMLEIHDYGTSKSLSNLSDRTLIERLFGTTNESQFEEGLMKEMDNLKKLRVGNKPQETKEQPKKVLSKISNNNVEKEEINLREMNFLKKNNAFESYGNDENQKIQKPNTETSENKKPVKHQDSPNKVPIKQGTKNERKDKANTNMEEKRKRLQYEEYSVPINQSLKSEKVPVNAAVISNTLEKKTEYWPQHNVKGVPSTPLKSNKITNKNEGEPKLSKSDGKIRKKKSQRSVRYDANKQPGGQILLEPNTIKKLERNLEQPLPPNTSERLMQIMKEFIQKRGINSAGRIKEKSKKKSRNSTEEKGDSHSRRLSTKNDKSRSNKGDKSHEMKPFYAANRLYLSNMTSNSRNYGHKSGTEDKTSLGRSKTEEFLANAFQKSFNSEQHSQTLRQRIASNLKVLTSFTDNQQKELRRAKAFKDRSSLGEILSNTIHNLKTQSSLDHLRSLRGNLGEERATSNSASKAPKVMSARSLHNPLKSHGKTSVSSAQGKSYSREIYDYNTIATRRTTGMTASIPSLGGKPNMLTSVPDSPKQHLNLKINLKRISQEFQGPKQDSVIDNSYGFWTGRSSKGINDSSRKSAKTSPRLMNDRGEYSHKYNTARGTEKNAAFNSRRATKVSMYQEFKQSENEMLRSIKHQKPDYLISMWPPSGADRATSKKQGSKKKTNSRERKNDLSQSSREKKRIEVR